MIVFSASVVSIALTLILLTLGWMFGRYRGWYAWVGGLAFVLLTVLLVIVRFVFEIPLFSDFAAAADVNISYLFSFVVPALIGSFLCEHNEYQEWKKANPDHG